MVIYLHGNLGNSLQAAWLVFTKLVLMEAFHPLSTNWTSQIGHKQALSETNSINQVPTYSTVPWWPERIHSLSWSRHNQINKQTQNKRVDKVLEELTGLSVMRWPWQFLLLIPTKLYLIIGPLWFCTPLQCVGSFSHTAKQFSYISRYMLLIYAGDTCSSSAQFWLLPTQRQDQSPQVKVSVPQDSPSSPHFRMPILSLGCPLGFWPTG